MNNLQEKLNTLREINNVEKSISYLHNKSFYYGVDSDEKYLEQYKERLSNILHDISSLRISIMNKLK